MSGVIKAEEFLRLLRPPEPFSLKDIEREAEDILSAARARASVILERAVAEAKELKVQGHEEGFEKGRARGEAEGREEGYRAAQEEARREFKAQQAHLVTLLQDALATFNEHRTAYLARAESDLIDLMLAVARRVVKRIGAIDREVAVENLREAIQQIGKRGDLVVRVNPKDMEAIRFFAEELVAGEKGWGHVDVVEDANVSPGGCLLLAGEGEVDATIETQMDHLASLLISDESVKE